MFSEFSAQYRKCSTNYELTRHQKQGWFSPAAKFVRRLVASSLETRKIVFVGSKMNPSWGCDHPITCVKSMGIYSINFEIYIIL